MDGAHASLMIMYFMYLNMIVIINNMLFSLKILRSYWSDLFFHTLWLDMRDFVNDNLWRVCEVILLN